MGQDQKVGNRHVLSGVSKLSCHGNSSKLKGTDYVVDKWPSCIQWCHSILMLVSVRVTTSSPGILHILYTHVSKIYRKLPSVMYITWSRHHQQPREAIKKRGISFMYWITLTATKVSKTTPSTLGSSSCYVTFTICLAFDFRHFLLFIIWLISTSPQFPHWLTKTNQGRWVSELCYRSMWRHEKPHDLRVRWQNKAIFYSMPHHLHILFFFSVARVVG